MLWMSIVLFFSSCDQLIPGKMETVTYSQLTAEKNYWDSIPGKIKVRDKNRPYRYFLGNSPYTGKVEDFYKPEKPKLQGTFKDGYADGLWKYYQQNDSLEQTGSFENGYVIGEWKFYDRHGKMDTRILYHAFKDKRSFIASDTLFVKYDDGSYKELQKDKVMAYYYNGHPKNQLSLDGSSGTFWDINGQVTDEMKYFIKKNVLTKETIYFVNKGKNPIAYKILLESEHWSEYDLEMFTRASAVTTYPMTKFSPGKVSGKIRVDFATN